MYHELVSTALDMPRPVVAPVWIFLVLALPLTALAAYFFVRANRQCNAGATGNLLVAALAAQVFLLLALQFHYFPYGVDDSFISYRYAENLAQGEGLVFNHGERVEGFSNPLWTVLLAGFAVLGLNRSAGDYVLPLTAKLLSVACQLAAVVVLVWWATRRAARVGTLAALFAGLAWFTAAGPNMVWAPTGMETAAHALLLLLAAVAWSERGSEGPLPARPKLFVATLLLLVLSRPEGILFSLALLALWSAHERAHGKGLRQVLPAAVAVLGLFAAVTVFRWLYFGRLLPNTFFAKATGDLVFQLQHGLQYLSGALLTTGGLIWLPALWIGRGEAVWRRAAPLVILAVQAAFILPTGGDWMSSYRFWAHGIPVAVLGLVRFADERSDGAERLLRGGRTLLRPAGLLAAAMLLMGMQALAYERVFYYQTDQFVSGFRRLDLFPEQAYYEAGVELRRTCEPEALVAIGDAGLIPYVSGVRTLDCHGLLDPNLAALPGRLHEKTRGAHILKRQPDYVLLGPVAIRDLATGRLDAPIYARDLMSSPEFVAQYAEIWRNRLFILYRRHAQWPAAALPHDVS